MSFPTGVSLMDLTGFELLFFVHFQMGGYCVLDHGLIFLLHLLELLLEGLLHVGHLSCELELHVFYLFEGVLSFGLKFFV